MKKTHIFLTLFAGLMAFTSCGAQKAAVKDTVTLPSQRPKGVCPEHCQLYDFHRDNG